MEVRRFCAENLLARNRNCPKATPNSPNGEPRQPEQRERHPRNRETQESRKGYRLKTENPHEGGFETRAKPGLAF